jgi:acetyltransferase-like isoleucine patch superfamily enzyme
MKKHSRLKRLVGRIGFRLAKLPLYCLAMLNQHRLYMRFYVRLLRAQGMKLNGTPRYIGATTYFDDLDHVELGDRVVISDDVIFLTHDYSATTALLATGAVLKSDIALVRGISLGRNVFIGKRSIIMPNTQIGDNVVVGAGSVVRGKVPSDSVLIGNPAKIIFTIQEYAERCQRSLDSGLGRLD